MLKFLRKKCYNITKEKEAEKRKMYEVLDVARYIINYCNKNKYSITNLKLQKLLYFVQAMFLINFSEPCFCSAIEAWDYGPVVPDVYNEFKKYGSSNIPVENEYLYFDDNTWNIEVRHFDDSIIDDKDKSIIQGVVEHFADYSAGDLVHLTHMQAPWKNAYKKGRNAEISTQSIRDYF